MGNLVTYYKSHHSHPNRSLQVTDTDKAILDLRIARKQLVTYKRQQEQLVERSQEVVGQLLRNKQRERAITALKKKKLHDKQALTLEQNILKLDEQVVALETTEQQVDTVSALRTANQAMKAMQKQMPLDAIEKLMQENEEAAEYVEKVNNLLDGRLGDDAIDVDDELAALEAEIADEQAAAMPTVPTNVAEVEPTADVEQAAATIDKPNTTAAYAADELPAAPTHAVQQESVLEESEVADEATLVPA